jgi:rRNA maturation protein Nop10
MTIIKCCLAVLSCGGRVANHHPGRVRPKNKQTYYRILYLVKYIVKKNTLLKKTLFGKLVNENPLAMKRANRTCCQLERRFLLKDGILLFYVCTSLYTHPFAVKVAMSAVRVPGYIINSCSVGSHVSC